ncbi:MAG: hypothetical protein ACI4QN_02255, partial [Candidatus Coproplasma sp.]
MNKSVKKIALSLLLALVAIVLCFLGSNIFKTKNEIVAEAASASVTDIKIEADTDQVDPGGTITFTVTITSGQSSDMHWSSINLVFSALDSGTGAPSTTTNADFSLDTTYTPTYSKAGSGYGSNITKVNALGKLTYSYANTTSYISTSDDIYKLGFNFGVGENGGTNLLGADEPIVLSYRLSVSSTASNGVLNFGVSKYNSNMVAYDNADWTNEVLHEADTSAINCNSLSIRIGKASTDATLKSLSVGASSASTAVTIADNMTYANADTGTSFKFKAAVNDSTASMKYCVGTGTPTTALSNDTETSITLDSSGETTVKILVTAEDATTTKTYTLVIKSSYARLSNLAVTINRPASADTVSGMGLQSTFDKDTTSYTVKVPSDNTSVD